MTVDRVTVVLWHGQYLNDAKANLDLWQDKRHDRIFFGLRNARIEGSSSDWRLVADAFVNEPAREKVTS